MVELYGSVNVIAGKSPLLLPDALLTGIQKVAGARGPKERIYQGNGLENLPPFALLMIAVVAESCGNANVTVGIRFIKQSVR